MFYTQQLNENQFHILGYVLSNVIKGRDRPDDGIGYLD